MKTNLLWFLFVCFVCSCSNNQQRQEADAQIQAAIAEKVNAEKNLSDFKIRSVGDFKEYDSLKAKGTVPEAVKSKHDSLFAEGVGLAMVIVHKQMKIDSLKKIN
jgi:hypothetical protein